MADDISNHNNTNYSSGKP